jgi:hypothetical protein
LDRPTFTARNQHFYEKPGFLRTDETVFLGVGLTDRSESTTTVPTWPREILI